MTSMMFLSALIWVHSARVMSSHAPVAPPPCLAVSTSRASRLLHSHRDLADIPGMQVAVWRHGEVLWSAGIGDADVEQRTPVTPLTRFRIASVSKALTAAGMMRLVQDGQMQLDAPVSRYVPNFPAKRWPITVRQLASGTSGIRHYRDVDDASNTAHFSSVTEALRLFRDDSLLFEPGTRWAYSSPAFVLLSAAMESAAGQSYLSFMQQRVFSPLGMNSTTADHSDSIISFRSRTYVDGDNGRLNAPAVDASSKWAAGGFLSTATDLARFGTSLLANRWLDSTHMAALFAPVTLRNGSTTTSAMGWDLQRDAEGRRVIAMDGSLPSARSLLLLYPDQGLVLALLMNTGQSTFMNQQEGMFLAEQFLVPDCPPIAASPGDDRWTGDWRVMLRGFDGRDVSATLQLYRRTGEYQGIVALDDPFFAKRPMPVPAVVPTTDGLQMMVTWGGNWMRITLPNDTAHAGRWHLGPQSGEVRRLGPRDAR